MNACRALLIVVAGLSAPVVSIADAARAEELTFQNNDIQLSGTVFLPVRPAKVGLLLIHGSAQVDSVRMTALGRLIADRGFAVYTYDKRGIGRSGGTFQKSDDERAFTILASDAVAAFRAFARHPEIGGARIGLLGISQGGWVGPIAASQLPDAAFMVLWSGPVCSVGEELHFSAKAKQVANFSLQDHGPMMREHMRSVPVRKHDFEPRRYLSQLSLPTLWIYGGRDSSIPVELSIERIRQMIEQGKGNFEFLLFPEQGHSLEYPAEYPGGYEPMLKWIASKAAAQ